MGLDSFNNMQYTLGIKYLEVFICHLQMSRLTRTKKKY